MKQMLAVLCIIWLQCYFAHAQSFDGAWHNPAFPLSSYMSHSGGTGRQAQWPALFGNGWAGQGPLGSFAPGPLPMSLPPPPPAALPWVPLMAQMEQAAAASAAAAAAFAAAGAPPPSPWGRWAKAFGSSHPPTQRVDAASSDPNIVPGSPYRLSPREDVTPSQAAINAYNDMYKEVYKMLAGQPAAARSSGRSLKTASKSSPPPTPKKQPLLRRSMDGEDGNNEGAGPSADSRDKSE